MRVADLIAYVNHDIDDATRAGLLQRVRSAARQRVEVLGRSSSARIGTHGQGRRRRDAGGRADRDPHERRRARGDAATPRSSCSTRSTRTRSPHGEFKKAHGHPGRPVGEGRASGPTSSSMRRPSRPKASTPPARDFIAGMTDRYAVALFEQLFIPQARGWDGSAARERREPVHAADRSMDAGGIPPAPLWPTYGPCTDGPEPG